MKQKDIDNILKANKKLDWVKRLYEKDTPSIVLPGQEYPSTHYMESSDNLVYPTIIRNADGKLEYLGNKARDYAIKTNTAIKLGSEEDANWFGENYKKGTNVLKQFKKGGKITAETIYSVSKQPKVILTPNDIYAKDGAKVKPGVWNNFEPITYNRANDYPEAERVSLSKIKNPIEGKIYIDDERPFHYKEGRFQEYYSPEEIKQILKFRGEQEANKTSIPSEISNPITNMLYNVDSPYREFIRSQKKGFTYDEYKDGGKIDLSNTVGDRKVFSLDEFKNIVPDYQYQGYLNSGKEGLYKNINKLKYPVQIDTLPDGSVTYRPYSYESAETSYEDYKKLSQSDQPIKATPITGFKDGGIVQAWVQKFAGGGSPNNPYIDPYAGMTEFNPEIETNMQSMPFQKLQTQPINQSFNNLQPKQFNTQIQVPLAQSNMPQNMGTNFKTSFDASNDQVNMDNKQASSMMGGDKMSKMNPADMALGAANMVGDVASGAINAFAKPGSKAAAYAQGSAKAQSVVKPLEKIPIIGQASKLISGIIGGALEARRQGIEDEETDKQDKQTQYLTRNTQSVNQPSYYGQYMAKYGANPKMMEQRVMDDIYSDFDKYLKLT